MKNQQKVQAAVLEVIEEMRKHGKPFPTSVEEIQNLPFSSFDNLLNALREKTVIVQRFSFNYNNNIFELFASEFEKNLYLAIVIFSFLIPIISIALAFIYSWWWLSAIPSFFFMFGKSKNLYNKVVLSSALSSELNFCFLYVMGQVCVTTSDFDESYYWNAR